MGSKPVTIRFAEKQIPCKRGKSVLEALLEAGVKIPFSCRSGNCQKCKCIAGSGALPEESQRGLSAKEKSEGYFLACQLRPRENIEVLSEAPDDTNSVPAKISHFEQLSDSILRVLIQPEEDLPSHPGQHINLTRDDGTSRTYSIADYTPETALIELHIQLIPGGNMSTWLGSGQVLDTALVVTQPRGDCYYRETYRDRPLLLIGTGSGLAPLYGVLRKALEMGHKNDIRLYHGSATPSGLYLDDELRGLSSQYSHFHYLPCLSRSSDTKGKFYSNRACDQAFRDLTDLSDWEVFLAGKPEMVSSAKKRAYLGGASLERIHADPFTCSRGDLQK